MPNDQTSNAMTTTWNTWVRDEARALQGDLFCRECDGERHHRDGSPCGECGGTGIQPASSEPEDAGAGDLLNALTSLAATVAFVKVNKIELPERSAAFVAEVGAALGDALVDILRGVENLEHDVALARRRVPSSAKASKETRR